MARQSVAKHLAILEAAELITTVRRGREKLRYLNAAPIRARQRDAEGDAGRVAGILSNLKTLLETGEALPLPT